jgi:hypothetical protein
LIYQSLCAVCATFASAAAVAAKAGDDAAVITEEREQRLYSDAVQAALKGATGATARTQLAAGVEAAAAGVWAMAARVYGIGAAHALIAATGATTGIATADAAAAALTHAGKRKAKKAATTAATEAAAAVDEAFLAKDAAGGLQFIHGFIAIMQREVIGRPNGVGLTLHLCDVYLDEARRCEALVRRRPALFLFLMAEVPLFAMATRGDGVERRVRDNCLHPVAGGVFEQTFTAQSYAAGKKKAGTSSSAVSLDATIARCNDLAAAAAEAKATYAAVRAARAAGESAPASGAATDAAGNPVITHEALVIARAVAMLLGAMSLARTTRFHMRPIFAEATGVVDGYVQFRLNPAAFEPVTERDKRRALHAEIKRRHDAKSKATEEKVAAKKKRAKAKKSAATDAHKKSGAGKKKKAEAAEAALKSSTKKGAKSVVDGSGNIVNVLPDQKKRRVVKKAAAPAAAAHKRGGAAASEGSSTGKGAAKTGRKGPAGASGKKSSVAGKKGGKTMTAKKSGKK